MALHQPESSCQTFEATTQGPRRYMNATEPSARNPVVRFHGLGG